MSTSGKRTARLAAHATAVLLLIVLSGCTDAELRGLPGDLIVQIRLNPGVPGSVNLLQATFAASWQSLPAGFSDPSLFDGTTSANGTLTRNQNAQRELDSFDTATGLRTGNWQVSVTVTGDSTQLFSRTCPDPVLINRGATTTLTVTQDGGCTSQ